MRVLRRLAHSNLVLVRECAHLPGSQAQTDVVQSGRKRGHADPASSLWISASEGFHNRSRPMPWERWSLLIYLLAQSSAAQRSSAPDSLPSP
eukprot:scaffold7033_cov257-Pinguiococcus_pyrenoidosus.AAC.23